jgi:antitoxin component of MazEF toxin-antitoxin module
VEEGLELATLQTRISRRVADREYVKSELVIPRELVQKLNWSDDQTIDFKLYGTNKLLLTPTEPKQRPVKPTFETFAGTVLKILAANPEGLTWSEIRELGRLEQATPNPTWVYRMEKEHNLQRLHDRKTLQTKWKINLFYPPTSVMCRKLYI